LVMINSSGNRLETGSRRGFENVSFPFTARISYQTHSKLNNMKISCIIEFVINKPGHWEVILHN